MESMIIKSGWILAACVKICSRCVSHKMKQFGLSCLTELSKLMKQLGCTEAYNLDGGMTAMMAYGTELYSQPCGGGRQNCDIVYVAEPLS